jgi:hypothetical protein
VTLRIAATVGAPFTLWAALWGLMIPQRAGAQLVIWAVVAAAIVGAGAATTSMLFLRHTRARWFSLLGLLLAHWGVILALVIAALYGMASWPAPGRWTPLPPAPAPVARLEGPDCLYNSRPTIAVHTITGRRFWLTAAESVLTWEPEEKRSTDTGLSSRECSASQREAGRQLALPRPPSLPAQIHRIRLAGADCGGSAAYLLGQDGGLWQWVVHSCAIAAAALAFGTGVVVFVLGVWAFSLTVFSAEGRAWRRMPETSVQSAA